MKQLKVRVSDELKEKIDIKVKSGDKSMNEVLVELLEAWVGSGSQVTVKENTEVERKLPWVAEDKVEVEPEYRTTPQSIDEMLEEAWK